jgi:hypothetical protein
MNNRESELNSDAPHRPGGCTAVLLLAAACIAIMTAGWRHYERTRWLGQRVPQQTTWSIPKCRPTRARIHFSLSRSIRDHNEQLSQQHPLGHDHHHHT